MRAMLDRGLSEDGAFWLSFLRTLVTRGLAGVRLVTSDAHVGLCQAISAVLHGAASFQHDATPTNGRWICCSRFSACW